MSFSMPGHSKAENRVKEDIKRMDEAIMFLRKNNMVETADRLGSIRDYLAQSEGYFRRVEGSIKQSEARSADRMWAEVTSAASRRAK